jgi:hypothetical protein
MTASRPQDGTKGGSGADRSQHVLFAALVTIAAALIALSILLLSKPKLPPLAVEGPGRDALALLEELKARAERNAAELRRLTEAVRALEADAARKLAEAPPGQPLESAETTESRDSEADAVAKPRPSQPPSQLPFLDYETLPEEFLPFVGEDELFYLTEDGRLARLVFPGSDVSPRRDEATRAKAEEILSLHVDRQRWTREYVDALIRRGAYEYFPTLEKAEEHRATARSSSAKQQFLEQAPDGQGYVVLDASGLDADPAYRQGAERIHALKKELGVKSAMVFFVDPPGHESGN